MCSLEAYIIGLRCEEKFDEYFEKAKLLSKSTNQELKDERRRKIKRKKAIDESKTSEGEIAGKRFF